MAETPLESQYRVMRWRVFTSTWLSYAGFYLTRKALAAAKIPILDDVDLGFDKSALATFDFAYLTAYTVGQFINGPLSDKLGPRRVVLLGMLISIMTCFVTGLATGAAVFVVLMSIQGISQSTGWAPLVKNMSAWFTKRERGRIMGWWSTNYSIGGMIATPFAALFVKMAGGDWRYAFFGPAVAYAVIALIFFLLQRDRPEDVGLPAVEKFRGEEMDVIAAEERPEEEPEGSWKVIFEVATNPTVLILSFAYFCLKPVRYAFLNWGPLMVNEKLGTDALDSSLITAAFELGGPLGVIAAGYLSDRVFDSRRIPICAIMLPAVGLCLLFLDQFLLLGAWGGVALLFLIGFNVFGPDALLSGVAAMDFGTRKGAGTAAGMINGMGSLGAIVGGSIPGYVADRWGWGALFYGLAAAAFLAGLALLPLWNSRPPAVKT